MRFAAPAFLCVAAATAALAHVSPARAREPQRARFELEWKVEGACLDAESARTAIERSTHSGTAPAGAEPAVVRVTIARRPDGGWGADIWMYDPRGSGERSFEGTSCTQVAEAATLIVALALDEASPAATPPSVARSEAVANETDPPRAARAGDLELGLRATGDTGSLPAPTLGLGLLLAITHGALRGELEGTAWLPRVARGGPLEGSGGEFGLYAGVLRGCADVLTLERAGLGIGPCAGLEAGRATGTGSGISDGETSANFWVAGLLGLSARVHAGSAVGFGLSVEVGAPLRRPAWHIDEIDVFRPAATLTRASLHAVWRLP